MTQKAGGRAMIALAINEKASVQPTPAFPLPP